MAIKASELIKLLEKHIEKHGDGKFYIYDDYDSCYKSIDEDDISVTHGGNLVIEFLSGD